MEEAEKLIEKFKTIEVTILGCGDENRCVVSGLMMEKAAKQCALLHCDLMIKEMKNIKNFTSAININHYTQLKEKIKQL